MKHPLLALAVVSVLSCAFGPLACSSSSNPPGADPSDAGTSTSWTAVYTTVLSGGTASSRCTDHHSGGTSAAGNLDLSTQARAYANLVGVIAAGPSCGAAGLDGSAPEVRVVPGDAATSLLYQKILGAQPLCGAPMPDLTDALPASQIALVKSWIDEGAPND